MNTFFKAFIGGAAVVLAASSSFGESLLGLRYVDFGIATDSDFEDFSFGVGYNMKLKDGLDFGLDLSSDEGGDSKGATVDFTFYGQIGKDENFKAFISPMAGYVNVDVGWRSVSDFVYGVSVGAEYEIDEESNFVSSLSYIDTEDFGDIGLILDVEYNRWFSDSFNAGVGVSYSEDADDVSFSITGRYAF